MGRWSGRKEEEGGVEGRGKDRESQLEEKNREKNLQGRCKFRRQDGRVAAEHLKQVFVIFLHTAWSIVDMHIKICN